MKYDIIFIPGTQHDLLFIHIAKQITTVSLVNINQHRVTNSFSCGEDSFIRIAVKEPFAIFPVFPFSFSCLKNFDRVLLTVKTKGRKEVLRHFSKRKRKS